MNQPAKVYDPESIRTDYIERKRRNRRVQYPPMSYWNKYAEMTDEEEFCQAVNVATVVWWIGWGRKCYEQR